MKLYFSVILFFCFQLVFGTNPEDSKVRIKAFRSSENIKVDGQLDEALWAEIIPTSGFTQLEPNPGEPSSKRTEVRVIYDDEAVYIGAKMFEDPDQIAKQLFERDNMNDDVQTDFFAVAFDTYKDGINGLGFILSAAGVQSDIKFSSDGDDSSWDAVWSSSVKIVEDGWIAEIKIPYSALRFPDKPQQEWHVQFMRKDFELQEESFWSPIDPEVNGFFTQAGILEGIQNIKPPIRLSATPFVSFYAENYKDKNADPSSTWGRSFNGGMDIKYGISDAFTLDMTLIPDFGQVQSDNEVLNLSPFEVQFDENRQFFTEGTELFNKANIFYSRRVGGQPVAFWDVEDQIDEGDIIKDNPGESQLINATKISGRTSSGTGIGVFNAIAGREYATVEKLNGDTYKVETNPLTNYNVTVFDQNLKNNSYISIINTNVWREGHFYDANVTGTEFELKNRDNSYGIAGSGAISQKMYGDSTDVGYKYQIEIGKISGNWNWEAQYSVESDQYDPNDLGFIGNNNERSFRGVVEYNHYEPFGNFLRMGGGLFTRAEFLYKYPNPEVQPPRDNLFQNWGVNIWWWAQTKNFQRINIWTFFRPTESYDYFEPRNPGRVLIEPKLLNNGFRFSTDSRKAVSLSLSGRMMFTGQKDRTVMNFGVNPSFRLSSKFSISYEVELSERKNDIGYVTDFGYDDVVLGRRDVTDVVNLINANYSFNPNSTLSFRLRHNWTRVDYKQFYQLLPDGNFRPNDYNEEEDLNFNAFTIDAIYRLRFAPGSDMFLVWKNSIFGVENQAEYSFFENLDNLWENPTRNSFSVKVLYYFDFLNLRSKNS